jgi:hypothetical protein
VDKIAVAVDHKTGEKLSTTREGSRGVFSLREQQTPMNQAPGRRRIEPRWILFPKRVAETTGTNQSDGNKTITHRVTKSIFFLRKVDKTDKTDSR